MNDKNRNLFLRVASAAVLLPIVVLLLWKGGLFTVALVSVAAALVASELYGICGLPLRHPAAIVGMLFSAALPYFTLDLVNRWPGALGILAFAPIAGMGLLTLVPPHGDLKKAAVLGPVAALGPPYAGLCLGAITGLREAPDGRGFEWILVALTVTWMNDTGAYAFGRMFGKHKLNEKVSPNKTWEGFWGGMLVSVVALLVVKWVTFEELRVEDCVILGVVASTLGPIGDLAESMLKRAYGVKDSGTLLPGHGGFYDRLDALLFNGPWVLAYALFLQGLV